MDGDNGSTTFTDLKGKTVTRYGNTVISEAQSKFGGTAAYFDGTGDYLTSPAHSDFAFGTADLTLECWLYLNAVGGTNRWWGICTQRYSITSNHSFSLSTNAANNGLYFALSANGTSASGYQALYPFAAATWYHVAICKSGTTLFIFVGGVLVGTYTAVPSSLYTSSTEIKIGKLESTWDGGYFAGYIDDLRITKGIARYTEDFSLPSTSYFDQALTARIRSPLDQVWGDAGVVAASLDQHYSIRFGADLYQPWSDAPILKAALYQPWGNAGVIKAQLVQRWQDMVTLRAGLDQPWAIMESLLVALKQPWAITSGPVQALLDQGWGIKDIESVLAVLHQPWAIASDGTLLRYTVEVLANGQPVRVSHINIEGGMDQDGDVLTCEIHPQTEAEYLLCPFGAALTVSITSQEGTDYFVFTVTDPRIDEQHEGTNYVVEAMSPAAMLGAPYADAVDGELTGLASEIATSLAGDLPIYWETVDWPIPSATWLASGETPRQLLKTLAAVVGAVVQSDQDGTIAIRPRYPVALPRWETATPGIQLTETLDCFNTGSTPNHRYGYNRFLVSNQGSSSDSLTLEQSDISTTVKEVRGYQVPWDGTFALTHTGGTWVNIEPMGIEEREETETVEFVAGAGSTKYPIYDLTSVNWQQTNLGTITTAEDGSMTAVTAGQSLCEITYTTRCRLWKVTDPQGEQLQLVAEL
ncbi:MAG: LamG domain-containing protein [Desulfobulbus sp.]